MPPFKSKLTKRKAAGTVQSIAATSQIKREYFTMLLNQHAGNNTSIQRKRLLLAIQFAPITTFEARKYSDVLAPAPRIKEMRSKGINITTLLVDVITDAGIIHKRVGMYVLKKSEVNNND